jgi:hypothetical protein
MSNGHGNSRRQAYGRRMKDLRTRRGADLSVDMDGPLGWNRGVAWDEAPTMPPAARTIEHLGSSARPR